MTLPTLRTQLNSDSGTQGEDCGAVTILNAIRWASNGKVGPRTQGDVGYWVRKVRGWANKTRGGLLLRGDCLEIYKHPELKRAFERAGVMPLRATYLFRVGWGRAITLARTGDFLHLGVDYGVLDRSNAPMGSDTFRGGHSIGLTGPHRSHEHLHVWDGDPLFDGRRGEFPRGWSDARLLDFRAAAAAWSGVKPGYATFIVIRRG